MYVKNAGAHLSEVTMIVNEDVFYRWLHSWPSQLNLSKFVTLHWASNTVHIYLMTYVGRFMLHTHCLSCNSFVYIASRGLSLTGRAGWSFLAEWHGPMLCSVKRHAVIDLCTITLTNKVKYDQKPASYRSPIMPCMFYHESRSFKCVAGYLESIAMYVQSFLGN